MQQDKLYSLVAAIVLVNLGGCCCGPRWSNGACDVNSLSTSSGYGGCCDDDGGCGPSCGAGGCGAASNCAGGGCVSAGRKPGPIAWLQGRWSIHKSRRWKGSSCDDVYLCAWKSDPPDYCDPCDRGGQWTGPACCQSNCWKDLLYRPLSRLSCKAGELQSSWAGSYAVTCGCETACDSSAGCSDCGDGGCASGGCDGPLEDVTDSPPTEEVRYWNEYRTDDAYPEADPAEILQAPASATRPKRLSAARAKRARTRDTVRPAR